MPYVLCPEGSRQSQNSPRLGQCFPVRLTPVRWATAEKSEEGRYIHHNAPFPKWHFLQMSSLFLLQHLRKTLSSARGCAQLRSRSHPELPAVQLLPTQFDDPPQFKELEDQSSAGLRSGKSGAQQCCEGARGRDWEG